MISSQILMPSENEQLSTLILPNHVENVSEIGENFIQMSDYNSNVALVILKMEKFCLLSHSTICEIINGVYELQNDSNMSRKENHRWKKTQRQFEIMVDFITNHREIENKKFTPSNSPSPVDNTHSRNF